MRRVLLFHFYPVRNSLWPYHLWMLESYKFVFPDDTIHFFKVALDEHTVDEYEIFPAIRKVFPTSAIFVHPNHRFGGEGFFMPYVLRILDHIHKHEGLVFYAHSKGVTDRFYKHTFYYSKRIHWFRIMYKVNLRDVGLVQSVLSDSSPYVFAGIFLTEKPCIYFPWHYAGTYFWFNLNKLSEDDFDKIITYAWFSMEGWPSSVCDIGEAYNLLDGVDGLAPVYYELNDDLVKALEEDTFERPFLPCPDEGLYYMPDYWKLYYRQVASSMPNEEACKTQCKLYFRGKIHLPEALSWLKIIVG
jgi:hypothetical protein